MNTVRRLIPFISITVSYIAVSNFIPVIFLLLINCIGYLPYSDRPGPSWQTLHLPTIEEINFYFEFSIYLLPSTALYGCAYSLYGLLIDFLALPKWAIRTLTTPIALLTSGLIMMSGGWMIAISAIGFYIAAFCGMYWGLFIFPRFITRTYSIFPISIRIFFSATIVLSGIYFFTRPFWPDSSLTNGDIYVIQKTDTGKLISEISKNHISHTIIEQFKSENKYIIIQKMNFTTESQNQLHALIVIDDDTLIENKIQLPISGDAIYWQHEGKWNELRTNKENSRLSLTIERKNKDINLKVIGNCCATIVQNFSPSQD